MKLKSLAAALVMLLALLALASAKTQENKQEADKPAEVSQAAQHDEDMRIEGEKRYHSNCSRCHAAPPKFPARMMGTIVRHMRVRAMLTQDDVRYILRYMTQ